MNIARVLRLQVGRIVEISLRNGLTFGGIIYETLGGSDIGDGSDATIVILKKEEVGKEYVQIHHIAIEDISSVSFRDYSRRSA